MVHVVAKCVYCAPGSVHEGSMEGYSNRIKKGGVSLGEVSYIFTFYAGLLPVGARKETTIHMQFSATCTIVFRNRHD
jgi:hypothetical protein